VDVDLGRPGSTRLAHVQPDRQELDSVQEVDDDVTRDLVSTVPPRLANDDAGEYARRPEEPCCTR
jgi:hypothetical protein